MPDDDVTPRGNGRAEVALGFVAGYTDVLGYLAVRVFSTHVTGNLVLIFANIDQPGAGLLGRLLAVPVFAAAAMAASMAVTRRGPPGRRAIRALLAVEVVLLLADMAAGAPLAGPHHALAPPVVVALILITAMGVHNAVNRFGVPRGNATAAMTVNVSQAAVDFGRLLNRSADAATRGRLRAAVAVILAFVIGAASGAGAYELARLWGLALPAAIVAVYAIVL